MIREIQNAEGNFSVLTNLESYINKKEKFGKEIARLFVRGLEERGIISEGNGNTELRVTEMVSTEFSRCLKPEFIKSKYEIKESKEKSSIKTSDIESLREIIRGCLQTTSQDNIEKEAQSLKKTLDAIGITVRKNPSVRKAEVKCLISK